MERRIVVVAAMALSLVLSFTSRAEPLPQAEVDKFVRPLVDGEACAGVVVALVEAGEARVFGYGRKSLNGADASPPDGKTVFEIGSATKTFTGLLLADMVARGEVKLDDPVQKYLPDSVKVPQAGDTPITLLHLATHMSGLPRMPDNMAPKDPLNPYADYTEKQLYEFLSRCKPAREPGEAFEYSNFGAALLGHALARRSGKGYEELVVERVSKPLGMAETRVALTPEMRKRLAPGYNADLTPAKNWDLAVFAPAGALRSTADDMARYVVANADPKRGGELAGAIVASHAVQGRADVNNDIALCWHVSANKSLPFVWHNGQTGGYHSFVGFVPGKDLGVVVLANTASGLPDQVGAALLRRMAGLPAKPPVVAAPAKIDAKKLGDYVGEYALSPAFKITVTREGDRLMARATGQQNFRIFPVGEDEFAYRVVDARITFRRGPDGKVNEMVLHQNGQDLPGKKTK